MKTNNEKAKPTYVGSMQCENGQVMMNAEKNAIPRLKSSTQMGISEGQ